MKLCLLKGVNYGNLGLEPIIDNIHYQFESVRISVVTVLEISLQPNFFLQLIYNPYDKILIFELHTRCVRHRNSLVFDVPAHWVTHFQG